MCGLFGWISKSTDTLTPETKKSLTFALGKKSETRGTDGWGILAEWYDKDKPFYRVSKTIGRFSTFSSTKTARKDTEKSHVVLGHTRMGTHGATSLKNTHPFSSSEFVWAHNGVIHNHENYLEDTLLIPEGDTDSECFGAWVSSIKKSPDGFLEAPQDQAFWVLDIATDKKYIMSTGKTLYYILENGVFCFSSELKITETAWESVFKKHVKALALEPKPLTATAWEITAKTLPCVAFTKQQDRSSSLLLGSPIPPYNQDMAKWYDGPEFAHLRTKNYSKWGD